MKASARAAGDVRGAARGRACTHLERVPATDADGIQLASESRARLERQAQREQRDAISPSICRPFSSARRRAAAHDPNPRRCLLHPLATDEGGASPPDDERQLPGRAIPELPSVLLHLLTARARRAERRQQFCKNISYPLSTSGNRWTSDDGRNPALRGSSRRHRASANRDRRANCVTISLRSRVGRAQLALIAFETVHRAVPETGCDHPRRGVSFRGSSRTRKG
jgi:hypothetical protein